MSIQLVLSHYLACLKERNELDVLLPDLLRAMGHSVLSRPQIGVAQGGVDVLSTCRDGNGEAEVFLFIVKFGNIGRSDFYANDQSISPSVRQAVANYVRTRLERRLQALPKRFVLVTNGVLKEEARADFTALVDEVAERPACSLELWGLDQLAPLIEQHLFSEALILGGHKGDLRAATAGLEDFESSIRRFVRFTNGVFDETPQKKAPSPAVAKKQFLKKCAIALMGWSVLFVWGRAEGNLKPAVVGGEHVILRMWAQAVHLGLTTDAAFVQQLNRAAELFVQTHVEYFAKVLPLLKTPRLLVGYRPLRALYTQLVFEEFGRLGSFVLMLGANPVLDEVRQLCSQHLKHLIAAHPGCRLPVLDGQSIDLSLALCALLSCGEKDAVVDIATDVIHRFKLAVEQRRHRPIDTDLIEDAISIEVSGDSEGDKYFRTSTLLPMLATVAACCGSDELLGKINDLVLPSVKNLALERWFPKLELEGMARTRTAVQAAGVSRTLRRFGEDCATEMAAAVSIPPRASSAAEFQSIADELPFLSAVSARLFRHPLPPWLIPMYAAYQPRSQEG